MDDVLPKYLQAGFDAARAEHMRRKARLRLVLGDAIYPVVEMEKTGFAVDLADAPKLRGLVDLYDGATHLFQCLIVASQEDGDLMRYEFKRATAVGTGAALDFERLSHAPAGLITKQA